MSFKEKTVRVAIKTQRNREVTAKVVRNSKTLNRFTRIQKEGTVKAVKNSKRLNRFTRI